MFSRVAKSHLPSPSTSPSATPLQQVTSIKPQYIPKALSATFLTYKHQRCLDGSIHVLIAPKAFTPAPDTSNPLNLQQVYNIFSAFPTLPIENPDSFIKAFPAIDSKADTLTQSQMLEDPDSIKFVQAQIPEIKGLQKMDRQTNIIKTSEC